MQDFKRTDSKPFKKLKCQQMEDTIENLNMVQVNWKTMQP